MLSRRRQASDGLRFFLLIGSISAAGPAAMDMYVPALPKVASDLGASTSATQLTVALYLLGLAVGQMVFGQLSDIAGRRRPLLAGLLVFALVSAFCSVAPSLPALCVGRFLQGATGASGMVIGRAVVRDLYGLTASARYYSRLTLIYGVAPIIAPLIGSAILSFTSWRGIFLVVGGFGLSLFAGVALWFPETLAPHRRRSGTLSATFATFGTLLRDRRFLGCALTLGLTMGAVVAYVATGPFVIQDGYGASPQLFAVLFGTNALAMVVGSQVNAHLLGRFSPAALVTFGIGMVLVGAGGMLVVALADLGLIALELCLACVLGSWGFVQGNILAVGLADHPATAGAGSALIGLIQFLIGALFAPLAGFGGGESPTPLAVVCLVCAVAGAASAYGLVLRGGPPVEAVQPEALEPI